MEKNNRKRKSDEPCSSSNTSRPCINHFTAPNVWQDNSSDEEPASLLQGKNYF